MAAWPYRWQVAPLSLLVLLIVLTNQLTNATLSMEKCARGCSATWLDLVITLGFALQVFLRTDYFAAFRKTTQ